MFQKLSKLNNALEYFKKHEAPTQFCIDLFELNEDEIQTFLELAEKHVINEAHRKHNKAICDYFENQ